MVDGPITMQVWLAWTALAALVFWWVGAYNRLVRLRAHALAAFATLDSHFAHYIVLVDDHLKSASGLALAEAVAAPRGAGPATAWAALRGASTQFAASLQIARRQALDAGAMAALQTAHATLHMSWSRVEHEARENRQLHPPAGLQHWGANVQLSSHAIAEFNRAVLSYNAAVTQFPALLLARVFGFRAAGCL